MKIEIPQEKLKKGLNIIEKISSKSLTLPILNNILLSVEKNFLEISATDLEIGVKYWILSKTEGVGKITVSARLLSGFINLLPEGNVVLFINGDILSVESGNYKTKIKGLPADDFPIIPKVEEDKFILINSFEFCSGLGQVFNVPALSTTRPEISGIYFSFSKDNLVLVATDSFRLGEKKVSINKFSLGGPLSLILPQKTAREIINIFGEDQKELKISVSSSQLMVESFIEGSSNVAIRLVSRLIDGEYPNYKEIIPKKHITSVVLNRKEFLNHLKGASLFSNKTSEIKIKVDLKNKTLNIYSGGQENGDYNSSIPAEIKGENTEVVFNCRFLVDGLNGVKSDNVLFELNSDSGPGVLKPTGDNSYLYVVMPIKNT